MKIIHYENTWKFIEVARINVPKRDQLMNKKRNMKLIWEMKHFKFMAPDTKW